MSTPSSAPLTLPYGELRVEITAQPGFNPNSADNSCTPDVIHNLVNSQDGSDQSARLIRILNADETLLKSAVVVCTGVAGIYPNSAVINGDLVATCCGNQMVAFSLPDLALLWSQEADWECCFQVFKAGKDLITHGELSIKRISQSGAVLWDYSGADIFVAESGETLFELTNEHIICADWNNDRYVIDVATGRERMVGAE